MSRYDRKCVYRSANNGALAIVLIKIGHELHLKFHPCNIVFRCCQRLEIRPLQERSEGFVNGLPGHRMSADTPIFPSISMCFIEIEIESIRWII